MLLPLAFLVPLLLAAWRRRRIPAGASVEITFDMSLPSKWAAELTQRALSAEGVRARVFREQRTWLCSVARPMKYQAEAVGKAARHYDQLAAARGGQCMRYRVALGRRVEEHLCKESHSIL